MAGVIWDILNTEQRREIKTLGVTGPHTLAELFASFDEDDLMHPSTEERHVEALLVRFGCVTLRGNERGLQLS